MLGLQDIIGMCACTEEEIRAVAMHENIPDAIAAELADYLVTGDDGVPKIRGIIVDDILKCPLRSDRIHFALTFHIRLPGQNKYLHGLLGRD